MYEEDEVLNTSEEEAEAYLLAQRALTVKKKTRPIDSDTEPLDGSEFIHKSRLEAAKLDWSRVENPRVKPVKDNEHECTRQWARESAAEFSRMAIELSSKKTKVSLQKKYPKRIIFPRNEQDNIQDWCTFCLGSKLCSEIYGDEYEGGSEQIEPNSPLLSIIMHFDRDTAFTVLKNLHEWFLKIGMDDSIARWVYAICACVKKPLDDNFNKLIEAFYKDCQKRLKACDESEKFQLYLISGIMKSYFCVNADTKGFSLETFLRLKSSRKYW